MRYVNGVNGDFAGMQLHESEQTGEEGAFAGARSSNDAYLFSRSSFERNAL